MDEVSEFRRDGGGVGHSGRASFHDQLQLLEDVRIFVEGVWEAADGQLKLCEDRRG